MRGKESLDIRGRENGILRERAVHFEVALNQTIDSSYQRCRHAMSVLHDLCRFLEALRHEHDIFRQALEDFRRELVHSNLSAQLRSLPRSGGELINILRCYLDREDDELHPVILKEFAGEELPEESLESQMISVGRDPRQRNCNAYPVCGFHCCSRFAYL